MLNYNRTIDTNYPRSKIPMILTMLDLLYVLNLSKQLRTPGMLVMTDAIRNRVARNRERGIRTHVIMDEMHIFFANELSSQFFAESWKQFRKDGALATGITQNVEDCLRSVTARTMLANSEYLVLLNQAPTDQIELKVIQSVLGHADLSTTINTYIHATEDFKKEEFSKRSRYLSIGAADLESETILS